MTVAQSTVIYTRSLIALIYFQFLRTVGCDPPCRYPTFRLSVAASREEEVEGDADPNDIEVLLRAPNPYR